MFKLNNTYPLTRLNDFDIKYVSLISKYQGKWVICHLKDLDKWDCPGGGIEPGAVQADYYPLYIYEILSARGLSYGVQYFCNIKELAEIPDFEMDKIELVDELPFERMKTPQLHSLLIKDINNILNYGIF